MIIYGIWERHQNARHARRADLGNGERAGPADHKIAFGIPCRHIFDECNQLAFHACFCIILLERFQVSGSSLMGNSRSRLPWNRLQCLWHDSIQRLGTEASTNHQQLQSAAARRVSFSGRGQLTDLLRTGLPVNITFPPFLIAPGKPSNTLSATFVKILLVRPGIEFCSCISNGFANNDAIIPPGKAGYPPMPRTTSGRTLRMTLALCHSANNRRNGSSSQVPMLFPRKPENRIISMSYPCRGGALFPSLPQFLAKRHANPPTSCNPLPQALEIHVHRFRQP